MFDGMSVTPRTSVLVEGGVIRAVRPGLTIPRGAAVVDGAGKTLVPGLIDAHAHVHAFSDLTQALVFGVTTEFDMFSSPDMIRALAALDPLKKRTLADARFAGIAATAPGGHGTEYNFPIPTIRDSAQAQAFVDARLAEGSAYIKIMHSAGGPPDGQGPTLNRETLAALIAATHRRGKLAIVHIVFQSAAREALEAGADGLAHTFMNAEGRGDFASLARRRRAFVVPTLTVLSNACGLNSGGPLAADPLIAPFLLPLSQRALRQVVQLPPGRIPPPCDGPGRVVAELRDAGVPILAGTDVGNPGIAHGASLHGEMALLVKSGLSPTDALAAATSRVADAFRLRDRGRILPGLRADLVLVNGDPTADVSATADIVAVWKQGIRFDRDALRSTLFRVVPDVPPGSKTGSISDFEQGPPTTVLFGTGWRAFDAVDMSISTGGANGTRRALSVSGTVTPDRPRSVWAGIVFVPSGIARAPANLSGKRGVRFWARGDGGTHRVALISEIGRVEVPFLAGAEWQQFEVDFPSSADFDAAQFLYLIFAAAAKPGRSAFDIDEVAFY